MSDEGSRFAGLKNALAEETKFPYSGYVNSGKVEDFLGNASEYTVDHIIPPEGLLRVCTPDMVVNDLDGFSWEDDCSDVDSRAFFLNRIKLIDYTDGDSVEALLEVVFNEDNSWMSFLDTLLDKEDYEYLDKCFFGGVGRLIEVAHLRRIELPKNIEDVYVSREGLFEESCWILKVGELDEDLPPSRLYEILTDLKSSQLSLEFRLELGRYLSKLILRGVLSSGLDSIINEGSFFDSIIPYHWEKWIELVVKSMKVFEDGTWDLDFVKQELIASISGRIREFGNTFHPRPRIALILLLDVYDIPLADREKIYEEVSEEAGKPFFNEKRAFDMAFNEINRHFVGVIPGELVRLVKERVDEPDNAD